MAPAENSQPAEAPPPPDNELVIGLVGPVGIDLSHVTTAIAVVLSRFDYRVHDVHLSELMRQLDWDAELLDEPFDEHVWAYMTAGNTLRERWARNDALAFLAIADIARRRMELSDDADRPIDRQAWVLRSLKRPEEARLLRDVYGSRFLLFAAFAPESVRSNSLARKIEESRIPPHPPAPKYPPERLIARDQSEDISHGQAVARTFHLADFFIDVSDPVAKHRVGDRDELSLHVDLERIFEILFGHPHRTPSRDEFGMFQAVAAMRRSAELGRQVGAALCTISGDVIAVGVNEVPRPGGGLYWEGDDHDSREFQAGRDRSDERKAQIAREIASRLLEAQPPVFVEGVQLEQIMGEVSQTDLDNLIEFVRAVHAEMAAITDAARRGIPVEGSVLFVTTFPCHHCARHVVAAGISRVVYIAPYAKSLAAVLHDDAIVVGAARDAQDHRVRFDPFVGVGPSRYLQLFEPLRRKNDDGTLVKFEPKAAQPRLTDLDPPELRADLLAYLRRERRAEELLVSIQNDRPPRILDLDAEGSPQVP